MILTVAIAYLVNYLFDPEGFAYLFPRFGIFYINDAYNL